MTVRRRDATRKVEKAPPQPKDANGNPIRWIQLIDASGDGFLFTDQGGEWHAFSTTDIPPSGANSITAKLPLELDKDDPDNVLVAVILAKRFQEAQESGNPLSQGEIDRIATKATKLARRLPEQKKEKILAQGGDEREGSTSHAGGMTALQVAGWVGLPVLGYVLYRTYKKRMK